MQENSAYTIQWYEMTDSTSSMALRDMDSLEDKTVIAAEFQTAGRGQGDHVWLSQKGKNLTFTIVLKYTSERSVMLAHQQLITMISSLAVKDFLSHLHIEAKIKAPNDIYVDNKKICGMLIENGASNDKLEWSAIGIGINMNQESFPQELPNAVSARQLTGIEYSLHSCLEFFLEDFERRLDMLYDRGDLLRQEYDAALISFHQ